MVRYDHARKAGRTHKQEGPMSFIADIEQEMADLAEKIAETKKRLPAHSVKPPVMMDLLALEDEYDRLMKQRDALKAGKNR